MPEKEKIEKHGIKRAENLRHVKWRANERHSFIYRLGER